MTIFNFIIQKGCNSVKIYQYIGRMDRGQQQKFSNIIEIIDSSSEEKEEIKRNTHFKEKYIIATGGKAKGHSAVISKQERQPKSNTFYSMQKSIAKRVQYEDVCAFKDIQITNNLSEHLTKFKTFLEFTQKNVLFIFGPSGCGKTLLTLSALHSNGIQYEFAKEKEEQNEYGENVYEDSIDLVYRMFSSTDKIREKIYLFKDFPTAVDEMPLHYTQKYRTFKENAYQLITNISNRNKYIFLLNSQIYSSYYLLSQASENRAINQLKNVTVVKMEPYGPREMKKIINRFISACPEYATVTNQAKVLDEIVTEANGDARKALHIIYTQKIREMGRAYPFKNAIQCRIKFYEEESKQSESSSKHDLQFGSFSHVPQHQQEKQQIKVSIFHALGKLLYAKRYNVYYNPNDKKNKKSNNISCYYTQEQIDRLNPPFYFRPVELLEKSHLNINVCADLLEQNFLNRYGKVKDIAKMYNIFRYFDSYLEDTLNKFQIKQHMGEHLKELLTWGIIVYNKNSLRQSAFQSIQRSKNNIYQKIIDKKEELIRTYYLRYRTPIAVVKYSRKDIIQFGYYLRTANAKITASYTVFLQKLIDIIFDNGKRANGIVGSTIDKEISVIQDEEQEIAGQSCGKLNKITQILGQQLSKKSKIIEMMIESSDDSDIDSD